MLPLTKMPNKKVQGGDFFISLLRVCRVEVGGGGITKGGFFLKVGFCCIQMVEFFQKGGFLLHSEGGFFQKVEFCLIYKVGFFKGWIFKIFD